MNGCVARMMKKSNESWSLFLVQARLPSQTAWQRMSPGLSHLFCTCPLYLSFADHVHHLEALECSPRGLE